MLKGAIGFAAALAVLAAGPAFAGSDCSEKALTVEAFSKASTMAVKLRDTLSDSGAKVAIVGRVGSDISDQGLRYTHAGFVQRDHPKGRWVFVHLLNTCGSSSSGIYDEGLINFFVDDPFAYDAVIAVPTPPLQDNLDAILRSETVTALHNPSYSMIAYPFATKYQNSNQWLLEVLTVAQMGTAPVLSRDKAQAFHKAKGYQGDVVSISAFRRLGAGLFRANVQFDDHPDSEARRSKYTVVTVRSIIRYLDRTGGLAKRVEIALN